MKKVNTLQALGVLILLPVLAGFFAACDSDFSSKIKVQDSDIRFHLAADKLTITVHIPSLLNDRSYFVTFAGIPEEKIKDEKGPANFSGDDDELRGVYIWRTTIFTAPVEDLDGEIAVCVFTITDTGPFLLAYNTFL